MSDLEEAGAAADPLESEEFYALMQAYRFTRIADQRTVTAAYDAVKAFVREQCVAPLVRDATLQVTVAARGGEEDVYVTLRGTGSFREKAPPEPPEGVVESGVYPRWRRWGVVFPPGTKDEEAIKCDLVKVATRALFNCGPLGLPSEEDFYRVEKHSYFAIRNDPLTECRHACLHVDCRALRKDLPQHRWHLLAREVT